MASRFKTVPNPCREATRGEKVGALALAHALASSSSFLPVPSQPSVTLSFTLTPRCAPSDPNPHPRP